MAKIFSERAVCISGGAGRDAALPECAAMRWWASTPTLRWLGSSTVGRRAGMRTLRSFGSSTVGRRAGMPTLRRRSSASLKAIWARASVSLFVVAAASGCVQRSLTVTSNPPGALVSMNDQEIGRTPVTRKLTWYGTYDVELRLAGYASLKTTAPVVAPWWQWVPLDLFTEALPVEDHHALHFVLHPPGASDEEPGLIVERGEALREQLGLSERATTRPTTKPVKRAKRE